MKNTTKTLKSLHESTQIIKLKERLQIVDRRIINSLNSVSNDDLIFEAFDKKQMSAAIDIVKKLKALNFGALTTLSQARDAAINDVSKVLAGTNSSGLVNKIINLFKSEKDNPLVDTLAFANATNNFFGQFSQYMTALGGGDQNSDQTLSFITTGKSADELADVSSINGLGAEEKKKLGDFQKVVVNGFKPDGALSKVSQTWVDKYMKGTKGLKLLAKEMLGVNVKDLNVIANNVTNNLKNVSSVGQAAAGASQQATAGSTGTTGTSTSTSSSATDGTASTKSGSQPANVQLPKAGGMAKKVFDDIKADFDEFDEKTVLAILNTLDQNNKLKA
jgi:hypothetical protein